MTAALAVLLHAIRLTGWYTNLVLVIAAVVRVVFPLFSIDLYIYWIGFSQTLWIIAFATFVFVYAPMFLSERADAG